MSSGRRTSRRRAAPEPPSTRASRSTRRRTSTSKSPGDAAKEAEEAEAAGAAGAVAEGAEKVEEAEDVLGEAVAEAKEDEQQQGKSSLVSGGDQVETRASSAGGDESSDADRDASANRSEGDGGSSLGSDSSGSSGSSGSSSSGSSSDSDSGGEEDDEEDDADAALRRSLLGSYVQVQRHVLNSHLVCALCNGYFRDAHTVQECLHTFCKVCIKLHAIKSHNKCPTCKASLGHNMQDVRPDHTMQSLVGKLYPEYGPSADAAAEVAFYESKGIRRKQRALPPPPPVAANIARPPPSAAAVAEAAAVNGAGSRGSGVASGENGGSSRSKASPVPETGGRKAESTSEAVKLTRNADEAAFQTDNSGMDPVLSYEELAQANRAIDEATELPFRLVPDESVAPGHVLPNLDKPFLRTASQLTVKMLVKFLQHKVNNDKGQGIDLYCRGTKLPLDYSLSEIFKSRYPGKPPDFHILLEYRKSYKSKS